MLVTGYKYFFDQVLSNQDYWKSLLNLEVVANLTYGNSYKFGGNNFFFLDFNNFDLWSLKFKKFKGEIIKSGNLMIENGNWR